MLARTVVAVPSMSVSVDNSIFATLGSSHQPCWLAVSPLFLLLQVEVSPPQQGTQERVRQLNSEREALAQQRAQAECAKQV